MFSASITVTFVTSWCIFTDSIIRTNVAIRALIDIFTVALGVSTVPRPTGTSKAPCRVNTLLVTLTGVYTSSALINVFTGLGEGVDLVTHGTGSVTDTAVRAVGVDTALRGETDPCLFTLVYIHTHS